MKEIENTFGGERTFDLIIHSFKLGGRSAALVFLDGFIKDDMLWVLKSLQQMRREDLAPKAIDSLINKGLPYYELELVDNREELVDWVLSGLQVLLLDGESQAVVIDGRDWPSRTPEEPPIEKSTRGANDGFVETLIFNLTFIRRRIRDPKLRAEIFQLGRRSKNDLVLTYIEDIADPEMVEDIRGRLEAIDIDGLPLADKTVEALLSNSRFNPFPLVRYTERPDVAASHLLEGQLAIIVDNSPSVLLLPAPLLSHIQSIEDYRQGSVTGSYLKLLRLAGLLLSTLLPALWLLLVFYHDYLPEALAFIGPQDQGSISLTLQFILASLGVDMIRIASIHTPEAMATSLGIIGALLLGDFAVQVNLFQPEVILYIAVAAISSFTIVGKELSVSSEIVRIFLILMVGYLRLPGFIIGLVAVHLMLYFTKSFGVPYLWPILPFNYRALLAFILTEPVLTLSPNRPDIWNLKDSRRYPDDRN